MYKSNIYKTINNFRVDKAVTFRYIGIRRYHEGGKQENENKKVLSLGLSVLMLGSLLVGCGNKDKDTSTAEGKTLTIAGLDGGYGTEGWKKVIEKFEQDNGVKVNATFDKKSVMLSDQKSLLGKMFLTSFI